MTGNNKWYKSAIFLWFAAFLITSSSVVYQRMTGPTHPVRCSVEINDTNYRFKLLTSHVTSDDAVMKLEIPDEAIDGVIKWKRYKSHDEWRIDSLMRDGEDLIVAIPKQPMAGKVIYEVSLVDATGKTYPARDESVIIRFKDPVPLFVLLPHVLFMFSWMFVSTRTGIEALVSGKQVSRLSWVSLILLLGGGLIFGPAVQKYAFDAWWTGWPFGHDLTDNKTFGALIFWIIAIWRMKKNGGNKWVVIASIVTLTVYLIPHSMLGSEIDYTKIK